MGIYYRTDGTATPHPTSVKEAREKRDRRYDSCETCSVCNDCTFRFVHGGACVHCSRLEAIDFFVNNYEDQKNPVDAIAAGVAFYVTDAMCEKAGHVGIKTLTHQCALCAKAFEESRNDARVTARAAGDKWYTPAASCTQCGGIEPRRVNNNACRGCEKSRSTRNNERISARKRGEPWYLPSHDCHDCGTLSKRNVSTDVCHQCRTSRVYGETASSRLMRENPTMVIDKGPASALGFKVYRTGQDCLRGHKAWRYVSTGGCLDCKA